MKKPWVIGLLSVIPGLGLLVLGQVKKGLLWFVLTLLPFTCMLASWEILSITGFTIGLTIWITQGIYAVTLAKRQAQVEAGTALPERQVSIPPLPPGASIGEKSMHNARKAVMPLLRPDEDLKVALHGNTVTGAGMRSVGSTALDLGSSLLGGATTSSPQPTGQVYLGITENDLLLVKMDAFGKPSSLQRFPLSQVALVESRQGQMSDEVVINIGAPEPLRVELGHPIRQGTQQLVGILSKQVT